MKELCLSLPPSGAYAEHPLLESIPAEDQAALLPIIKLAFPILEWGRLQLFTPSEAALNMQMRQSIMQMDYHLSFPLSKEVLFKADAHSQVNVTQVSERAAPEESCTTTDDKHLISLGSVPREKCLGMDACKKDVLACTSSEYTWLQQQDMCSLPPLMMHPEASLGAAFRCGDHAWKRVSAENTLDLSSCTSHKSSESNTMQGDGVVEATDRHGDSKESVALSNNKRKSASTCWQEYDEKSKRVQLYCCGMTKDADSSQENKMRCFKGGRPESMGPTTNCSDELARTHVAGSAIFDATMELHKLERCRRSNGKQWRCAKNATPGTLYCEIHHKYRSKCRLKKSISPADASFLEQKRAAFLKEKQVNAARCKRTDGKLWQCSKQAMPGSLYCENHHNHAKKSKKQRSQLGATSYAVGKNKPVVVKEGYVSKLKEGNGLDEPSVYSSTKRVGLMQLCSLVAEEREVELGVHGRVGEKEVEANRRRAPMAEHEDGRGRIMNQTFQMEDITGLVSLTDGQKQVKVEPVLPRISSPKRKKSVNGLGQFTDGLISREASWMLEEGFISDTQHAGGSRYTDAKLQGNEDGFRRCHRNNGRQWRCSQLSKPGSSYCENHQMFERKAKAGETEGHKLENLPNREIRSPNEDRGDPIMDSADDCFAGISCHKEQLQQSEQSNTISSQAVGSLKQCQRKDGKGWQCLKDAKEGLNYCLHHLEYLSRRKACLNKDRNSKPVATGLSLSNKVSPAIPTILNEGLSASISHKHSLHNRACCVADPGNATCKQEHYTHIVGTEIVSPQESCSGSDNLVNSLADPFKAACELGISTHTLKAATILQESSEVNECTQKQEVCTSVSNLLDEISPSQDISKQEILTYVDSNTQQQQHSMLGASILGSLNEDSCVAHDSSLQTMCNEGSLKEDIKSPFDKTSAQHTLDTVGPVVTGAAFDKEQMLLESEQLNGTLLQEISSLKQCQRKDGKHWQCSNNAKQGQSYCSHHLIYIRNRRHASKSYQKAKNHLGTQDRRAIFAGDGLLLCGKVSPSATPSGLQKASSGRKSLSTHATHDVHGGLADPVDIICSDNNSDCQKQESSTAATVETPSPSQEPYSVACESI